VVVADAEGGVPDHAPYDRVRVIVTVEEWYIPLPGPIILQRAGGLSSPSACAD
jgi:hypothetical protein